MSEAVPNFPYEMTHAMHRHELRGDPRTAINNRIERMKFVLGATSITSRPMYIATKLVRQMVANLSLGDHRNSDVYVRVILETDKQFPGTREVIVGQLVGRFKPKDQRVAANVEAIRTLAFMPRQRQVRQECAH